MNGRFFVVQKKRSYIHTSPLKTCQKHVCPPRLFHHLSSDFCTLLRMGWHPSHLYHRESFSDVNVRMSCFNVEPLWGGELHHFPQLCTAHQAPCLGECHDHLGDHLPDIFRSSGAGCVFFMWFFFGRSKLAGGEGFHVFSFRSFFCWYFYFMFWQHEERLL